MITNVIWDLIMKRVLLFLGTNLAVIATISIVFSIFGIQPYLTANGINYTSLAIFCLIWGMGGSIISLLLSKTMAKMSMKVQVIDPQTATGDSAAIVNTVHRLARKAGLSGMPEVGIYDSPEPNAFATGANRNKALVAVSTGLLQQMSVDEVEAILGHEVSHIANGDMITMTLLQGVVNAFALFLSRIIAFVISTALARSDSEGMSLIVYYIVSFILDILLTFFGSIIVAAFSRWREYRADAGGGELAGRGKMISALQRLEQFIESTDVEDKRGQAIETLKISSRPKWLGLFASHPPLKDRIARLQQG